MNAAEGTEAGSSSGSGSGSGDAAAVGMSMRSVRDFLENFARSASDSQSTATGSATTSVACAALPIVTVSGVRSTSSSAIFATPGRSTTSRTVALLPPLPASPRCVSV